MKNNTSCIKITPNGVVLADSKEPTFFENMSKLTDWDRDSKFGQDLAMLWVDDKSKPFSEIGTLLFDDLFRIEQIHGDIYFCKLSENEIVSFNKEELDSLVAKLEVTFVFFKKDDIWNDSKER